MSRKVMPERVKLRDERMWVIFFDGLSRTVLDKNPGKWGPYKYVHDPELEALIESVDCDPLRALKAWLMKWLHKKPGRRLNPHGIHLLPGRLQELLSLPVRQVFIWDQEIYRIDPENNGIYGRITERLI